MLLGSTSKGHQVMPGLKPLTVAETLLFIVDTEGLVHIKHDALA
jgi:hypothetical protein